MTESASDYVTRWDGIKAVVTDERLLAAMWDSPRERQQRDALLSGVSHD